MPATSSQHRIRRIWGATFWLLFVVAMSLHFAQANPISDAEAQQIAFMHDDVVPREDVGTRAQLNFVLDSAQTALRRATDADMGIFALLVALLDIKHTFMGDSLLMLRLPAITAFMLVMAFILRLMSGRFGLRMGMLALFLVSIASLLFIARPPENDWRTPLCDIAQTRAPLAMSISALPDEHPTTYHARHCQTFTGLHLNLTDDANVESLLTPFADVGDVWLLLPNAHPQNDALINIMQTQGRTLTRDMSQADIRLMLWRLP
jgi:hypothetical protein